MKNLIVFQCRTITPMFMAGADNRTPELRAPSFKGVMRFWWRVVQAESNLDKLRKQEAMIFGGAGEGKGKSSFKIRVDFQETLKTINYQPLPHHTGSSDCFCVQELDNRRCSKGWRQQALANMDFSVSLGYDYLPDGFTGKQLECLFILMSILGGVGKRSRRGFGSFQVRPVNDCNSKEAINLNYIRSLLDVLAPGKYHTSGTTIVLTGACTADYPYLKEIVIGRQYGSVNSLLERIGRASHEHSGDHLGFARSKLRLASPIYVSVITDDSLSYRPIITTLNTAFERPRPGAVNTQQAFKVAIL